MRLFLTRHRCVNTVSSMRDDRRVATNRGKLLEREREAAASGTPGASRCGPREYRMHYSRTAEAGRR